MPSTLSSTPIGGVASGVMPDQVLGGPVWWYVMGLYVLTIVLALYCAIDAQRATRRERLEGLREPAWLYRVSFAVYLVCVVGVWIPAVPRPVSVVPVLLTPFALALGVAYLLRVVFPKLAAEKDSPLPEAKAAADALSDSDSDGRRSGADLDPSRNNRETSQQ